MSSGNLITGANYLVSGAQLITKPKFRLFIIVPILVNIAIFIVLTSVMFNYFSDVVDAMVGAIPDWSWLEGFKSTIAWIISVLSAFIAIVLYGYSFSVITNILAAPFYGFLAERVEEHITGNTPPSESIISMTVRTVGRELVKLWYFISRGFLVFIAAFILGFIPLAQFFLPVLLFLWAAWSMAIQYSDYCADNNQIGFTQFREGLAEKRFSAWGFGSLVFIGSTIPLVNIFVLPAAVAGGTILWIKEQPTSRLA